MVIEESNGALPEVQKRHLASVLENLAAVLKLVEELNNFPEVASLSSRPFNLTQVLRHAAASVRAAAIERRIEVIVRAPRAGLLTAGDPDKLYTALRLALLATVEFTCTTGSVQVRCSEDEEKLSLRIVSTAPQGPGGAAPDLGIPQRIFRLHGGALVSHRSVSGSYQIDCELPALRSSECM
jgi:signal transduction histidine kinase